MKRAIASENILNYSDISVLERQRACQKYHHQLDQTDYNSNFPAFFSDSFDGSMSLDPGWDNWFSSFWFGYLQVNYVSAAEVEETPLISSEVWRSGNFKKKKLESVKGFGALKGEDNIEKKNTKIIRGFKEEEDEEEKSKIPEENTGSTKSITKKKKVTKEQQNSSNDSSKSDYIHVRREKISERMKFLQDLVPGCNKITGKAGMLNEIINYVQSRQSQIEFLSMKLAVVNPRLDFEAIEDIFGKEDSRT